MVKQLVGYRIKELRINIANSSQESFAKLLGWDRSYLSRVESGKQNLTIESIAHICSALSISLKEFFMYMDEEHIEGIF